MGHDVGMAANGDEEAAEIVFEVGIDPLGGGPFAESDVGNRIEGDRLGAARMRIDQGDMVWVVLGRPRFIVGSGGGGGVLGAEFSRAGMAMTSRLMWPMSFGPRWMWIIVTCNCWGSSSLAKVATARKHVASEGRSATRSHPHKRQGESVQWELLDRGKLHLARQHSLQPSANGTRR